MSLKNYPDIRYLHACYYSILLHSISGKFFTDSILEVWLPHHIKWPLYEDLYLRCLLKGLTPLVPCKFWAWVSTNLFCSFNTGQGFLQELLNASWQVPCGTWASRTICICGNNQLQYARLSSSLVHSDVFPFYPSGDSVVTLRHPRFSLLASSKWTRASLVPWPWTFP